MFDKLLLAVDPSKRLKPAREYAIALSEKLDIPLVAAFIVNPKKAGTNTASLDTRDGFEALGKRQLDQIIKSNKSVKIKPMVMKGKRHKVLAKMVDEGIADTLILGPFRSYLSRLFTGSEVERILEYESSHAFVVREPHPLPGPGSPALVVVDGTDFTDKAIDSVENFAKKFVEAVEIAEKDISRAVTHNKGIMNGIDAVVIATGNDFRAVEAAIHAYASKDGTYKSLTHAKIENDELIYWIEIPISIGTVGGIINLHPMVKWCLNLLQQPNSKQLMSIIGAAGLAQNFSAIKSLITSGIQVGHMKMHLINILNSLGAIDYEKTKIIEYFKSNKVTFNSVKTALEKLRKNEL